MKKLILLGLVVMSSIAYATTIPTKAILGPGAIIKCGYTNISDVEIHELKDINLILATIYCKSHPEVANELDDRILDLYPSGADNSRKFFPKSFNKWLTTINDPLVRSVCDESSTGLSKVPDELKLKIAYKYRYDTIRNAISVSSSKVVRHYLRNQGKSFVTKKLDDGTEYNPMKVPMDELSVVLNNPRFNGVNEWFTKYGSDLRLNLGTLPADAEINQLKQDVLYGDKSLNANIDILKKCLGVDGYNAFIKEYNDGTQE